MVFSGRSNRDQFRWYENPYKSALNYLGFLGILLILTGLLYFLKTFKYKRINADDFREDDTLFNMHRPSISTQTSSMGINNDNLSSAVNQEINPKH